MSKLGSFVARHRELNLAFVDQGLVSGANFVVGVLVARALGLEEYGVYTLIWMAVLFLNGQHHAFIVAPMMSFAPKLPEEERARYYGGVVMQHLLVSVVALLLLGIGMFGIDRFLHDWEGIHFVPAVCVAAFAYQSQDALRRYFFVRQTPFDALLIDLIGYGGQVALLVGLFTYTEPQTLTAFWAVAGGMGLGAMVGAFRLKVTIPDRAAILDGLARHWRFAKWLIGSETMRWTSENFFVIISGAALGPFAAGVMNAAKTIMGVTHILFLGLGNVAPAGAAKAWHEGGRESLRSYLASITAYGGALTLLFAGFAALFPSFLLGLVFGEEYAEYGFALQWFAAIYMMTFLHIPLSAGLRALEHTGPLFWARGVATLFTLVAALPLIDRFGLTGALMGSFLVNVAQQATLFVAFRRALRATGGEEAGTPFATGTTADLYRDADGTVRKVYRHIPREVGRAAERARSEYEALKRLRDLPGVSTPEALALIESERPAVRMEECPGEPLCNLLRRSNAEGEERARIADQLAHGIVAINARLSHSFVDYNLNNTIYDRSADRLWFVDFADQPLASSTAPDNDLERSLGNFLENALFELVRPRNLLSLGYRRRILKLLTLFLASMAKVREGEPVALAEVAAIATEKYLAMAERTGYPKRWWYRGFGWKIYQKYLNKIVRGVRRDGKEIGTDI